VCLFFHWYGKWEPSKRVEIRRVPFWQHGQIVAINEETVHFEQRKCHFCPAIQEREAKGWRILNRC